MFNAAVVDSYDRPPTYKQFALPTTVAEGDVIIKVTAAALTHLAKSRANGTHYSSGRSLPFVPGFDGVGRLEDGSRVYFLNAREQFGPMGEVAVCSRKHCIPLPDDIDDVTAAAIGNPGMSAWVALKARANIQTGESVLVLGATGIAGKASIQISKHMKAGYVIAAGRDPATLAKLPDLGADACISLTQSDDELTQALRTVAGKLGGIDIVLDFIWGKPASVVIKALTGGPASKRIRYVQIGALASQEISLHSHMLRSFPLEIMGSGLGSVPASVMIKCITELMHAVAPAELKIDTEVVPLSEVEQAWSKNDSKKRIVFKINQ